MRKICNTITNAPGLRLFCITPSKLATPLWLTFTYSITRPAKCNIHRFVSSVIVRKCYLAKSLFDTHYTLFLVINNHRFVAATGITEKSLTSCHLSLQYSFMSIMASQITVPWTVCSAPCSGWHQWNMKVPHYCLLVRRLYRWLVGSLHRGPVIQKHLSYYDVIILGNMYC